MKRLLFIGDVIGKSGRAKLHVHLHKIVQTKAIDFTIVQGENCAGGIGITERTAKELFDAGVDCITTGNHVWKHKEIYPFLANEARIIRPANYPSGAPGKGHAVFEKKGIKIAVINLQGRVFMDCIESPFVVGREIVERVRADTLNVFVDFHAEATSEKRALALYLTGLVTGFCGTHTHVPTADERIMDGHTAYITDVGMVGSNDSVIGECREEVIEHFLTALPRKFRVAKDTIVAHSVVIEFDEQTGAAGSIERLTF
jgi:metallophosphoesterase (TIGR00282 family)